VRLKKALLHPDFYTTYYAFRHWFAARLADGQFPVWNPYWGIGQAADVWATIPLDLYTPLELALGPQYHLFQALQAFLLLAAALYGFTRLGFSPLLSAAGAVLFFLTPHITFFYFYFVVTHSYIAHILLFTFVVLWFRTGRRRYLFLITWATIFSMLGTKLEFWFYQTAYFIFLALAGSLVFHGGRLYDIVRSAVVPSAFMTLGVAAHAWQLNILVRLMSESGRAVNSGFVSLVSTEFCRNLAVSLIESLFLKLTLLAVLLILALRTSAQKAYILMALAGIVCALSVYQERVVFESDPVLENGSLESWAQAPEGRMLPEHFAYEGSADVKRTTAPGDARSGTSAVFIEAPATGEARLRHTLPDVSSYRGRNVRLTFWSRSQGPVPAAARAVIEDGYSQASVLTLPFGDRWVQSTLTHYVDAEAKTLSLAIVVPSNVPAGVLIDDIALERTSGFVRSKASRDGTLLGLFTAFLSSPVLVGALFGLALSLVLPGRAPWRDYATRSLLFFPFVYYYCRQAYGDLGEVHYVQLAPAILEAALAAGVWLGCGLLRRNPLAQLAYASVCFVLLMRDQGQIVLAYLTGWLWMPTRDNYIIDFSFVLLALLGLAQLASHRNSPVEPDRPRGSGVAEGLALVAVGALLITTHSNLYYVHPLMAKVPSGYPYFTGVENVRDLFGRLKENQTSRAYLDNEPFMEFHHGAGSSLLEGFSQVTSYASLNNSRYREWTTYHHLGIRPQQSWRGYTNEYTLGTIARLPRTNTLGYTNSQIYTYTLINRPPLDPNLLSLLGVSRIVHLYPSSGVYEVHHGVAPSVDAAITRLHPTRLRAITAPDAPKEARPMFVADLRTPLPRAFLVPRVRTDQSYEFESELSPQVEVGTIRTASLRLPFKPATITRYEPERVSIRVSGDDGATMLVLTDLYHPFWQASVDGEPAPIKPALFLFRGVSVPAGAHQVEFTCHIPNGHFMLAVSLLAGLGSALAFRIGSGSRRRVPPPTQENMHGTHRNDREQG
jgi:hypothetical protein